MSAEFEKIVLEKLSNLEVEMRETKEKVDKNANLINSLSEKVDRNTNLINNLSKKVDSNTNLINNLSKKVDSNTNLINSLSKKVDSNTNLINSLSEKVDIQGLNFARFEQETNVKLNSLFDFFSANDDSHSAYTKAISTLNAKTFDHDIRISVLEDYNKKTELLAAN